MAVKEARPYVFVACRVLADLEGLPVETGAGIRLTGEPPFELSPGWKSLIGEYQSNLIARGNLFLSGGTLGSQSGSHRELDEPRLTGLIWDTLLALRMAAEYEVEAPQRVVGISQGAQTISGVHSSRGWPLPALVASQGCDLNLGLIDDLVRGMARLRSDRQKFRRLYWGASILRRTLELRGSERLHGFMRSLEAILRGDRRTGEKDLIRRIRFLGDFTGSGEPSELRRLRHQAEHLLDLELTLPAPELGWSKEVTALFRAYQAERLAIHAYRKVFSDDALLSAFDEESATVALWRKYPEELRVIWGPPVNLTRGALDRFQPVTK